MACYLQSHNITIAAGMTKPQHPNMCRETPVGSNYLAKLPKQQLPTLPHPTLDLSGCPSKFYVTSLYDIGFIRL